MLRHQSRLSASLGLSILALALAGARGYSDPIPYQVQPIAGPGVVPGSGGYYVSARRPDDLVLSIDGLSDRGQLLFTVRDYDGGSGVFLYRDGHFISLPSVAAPDSFWPDLVATDASMNQKGEVAFVGAGLRVGWLGLFLWDPETQQSTPLVLPGLRPVAARKLVFGGSNIYAGPPLLNNQGDIAFTAPLSNLAGNAVAAGLFFRDHSGQVMPIAIPGDTLPGIGTIHYVAASSVNDSGVVAFRASVNGIDQSAFTWQNGKITPVALAGQTLPGGKSIGVVFGAWVNDVNRNVLLAGGEIGFAVLKGDQLTQVLAPGQMLPGGGVLGYSRRILSFPNSAGQSLWVVGILEGDRALTAAYRLDADGQLSLLARDGDTAAGGETITLSVINSASPIYGAAFNGKGQLALPVAINADPTRPGLVPAVMALLTPTGP